MKFKGIISYSLENRVTGKKTVKTIENTITNLGKQAFLFGGLAQWLGFTSVNGNYISQNPDIGVPDSKASDSNGNKLSKDADCVVSNVLLNLGSMDITGKTFLQYDSLNVIGKASTSVAVDTTPGIGYRALAEDTNTGKNIIVQDNKITATYKYGANVAGTIDTIAMIGKSFIIPQYLSDKDETGIQSGISVGGMDGTPLNSFAYAYTKGSETFMRCVDVDTLAVSDYEPADTVTLSNGYWFDTDDYIIGIETGNYICHAINKSTGTHTQIAIPGMGGYYKGLLVNIIGGNVYIAAGGYNSAPYVSAFTTYKLDLTNGMSSSTFSETVNFTDAFNANILYDSSGNMLIVPLKKDLYLVNYASSYFLIGDPLTAVYSKFYTSKYSIYNPGYCYRGLLIRDSVYVAKHYGNLFSYKRLEAPIEKTADDVLTISYSYELEG